MNNFDAENFCIVEISNNKMNLVNFRAFDS